jgi:hypothetical protein
MKHLLISFLLLTSFQIVSFAQNEQKLYYQNLFQEKIKSGKSLKTAGTIVTVTGIVTRGIFLIIGVDYENKGNPSSTSFYTIGSGLLVSSLIGIIMNQIGKFRIDKYEVKLKGISLKIITDTWQAISLTCHF